MLWRCSGNTLGCFDNALGVLWLSWTLGTLLWGEPRCLWVFDVFGVSRDTQSNLGFFRTKPLFPDVIVNSEFMYWILKNKIADQSCFPYILVVLLRTEPAQGLSWLKFWSSQIQQLELTYSVLQFGLHNEFSSTPVWSCLARSGTQWPAKCWSHTHWAMATSCPQRRLGGHILYHFIQFGSHASRGPPKCRNVTVVMAIFMVCRIYLAIMWLI